MLGYIIVGISQFDQTIIPFPFSEKLIRSEWIDVKPAGIYVVGNPLDVAIFPRNGVLINQFRSCLDDMCAIIYANQSSLTGSFYIALRSTSAR